jgi:hypothetical protein
MPEEHGVKRFKARIPNFPEWTSKETKTVPLKFRGVQIGEVQIDSEGNVDGKIVEETPDQLKRLCYEMVTGFSIQKD